MQSPPKKLLDQVRDAIRLKHYAYRTEETYVQWIRRYILFHNKRHPKEMGKAEIEVVLMTVYDIEVTDLAVEELRELRAFDRRPILEAIRQQLTYEPTVVTRNRKLLESLVPDFEAVPPIWELRVGDYRIFYDVDEEEKIVYIRAVRYKAPGQTTEDIVG